MHGGIWLRTSCFYQPFWHFFGPHTKKNCQCAYSDLIRNKVKHWGYDVIRHFYIRLHVRHLDYPQTKDAIAMVTKLEYEDRYDKALRYIFGRTLICRNLEVATQLARTTGLDCVTLDGDQVSSKGSLTGGYFNKSRSRLEIQKTRSEKSDDIQAQASYFQNYTNSAFKGSLLKFWAG